MKELTKMAAIAGVIRKVVWPKIYLIGDSLTEYSFSNDGCWGAVLADKLQRKCDVIPRGFSGYNSRMCQTLLPRIFSPEDMKNVVAMTIFLGANDSCDGGINPQQHVPLKEYGDNITFIAKYLEAEGVIYDKIIFISPPPVDEEKWGVEIAKKGRPMSKTNETTSEYAKTCCSMAEKLGCDVVDLYTAMMSETSWKSMLSDGLHLSTPGSHFLVSLLWPHIEKRTEKLPHIFPTWDDMNNNDPGTSLSGWCADNLK